ncbi:hypothetical protein CLAFUW4_06643 [Fulvia fulva]|nr:hypothetical protein CLAFUR4_06651 [Fulvia fulva]WPV16077.1 hypothetical protein CLAFUW4_06643 [Fulvia fulva]WPV31110.1 hypothetical protein CLAFUW7_06642 [Fulvia fulva]
MSRMATADLSELPPELLLRITDCLNATELLPLSATNWSFRDCLVPVIFSTLRVTNRRDEAKVALDLAKKHSQHITTLSFEGYASPTENDRATRGRSWGPKGTSTLPAATRNLLTGLHLPKFRTARIRFAYDYASEDWATDPSTNGRTAGFHDFDASEFDKQIAQQEPKWKWRALMAETWLALAQNKQIENFETIDLPPRGTTAFINPAFQDFLRRLKRVTLSIWGSSKGAGWRVQTFPGYIAFLSCMHNWFFKQLETTTTLALSASLDGLPGLTGTLLSGIALQRDALPLVSTLELSLTAINPNLIAFISGHAQASEVSASTGASARPTSS